jgi:acyl carrier protein
MGGSATVQQVAELLEEATQAIAGTIAPECDLRTLDGWDSMGMVMFMGLLNERMHVELTVHELRASATPLELLRKIEEKRTR